MRKFQKKTPVFECLFNKVAGLRPATLLKIDSNTGVFWEISDIIKNTYFEEHLRTTASALRNRS